MLKNRAVIFLNGIYNHTGYSTFFPVENDLIIAVDGGLRHLLKLNVAPSLLIGDLDSISPTDLEWCQSRQVVIHKFPREKDQTDFELALDHAIKNVQGELTVYGALGGRMDHVLANIGLLSNPRYLERDIKIVSERETLFFIRQRTMISGKVGQTISLIPWGDLVRGISTSGLQYPLKQETLYPYQARGVSNVMSSESAIVEFKEGKLLCIITY